MGTRGLILAVIALVASVVVAATEAGAAKDNRCDGQPATIVGTSEPETLVGTAEDDVIVGLGGADTIRGLGGDDVICGGGGADHIEGGDGDDVLFGGRGDDRIFGGRGADRLSGGKGADRLKGNKGSDDLRGSSGPDTLFGGPKDDRLRGGNGADDLQGNGGDDYLDGGAGTDQIDGGAGTDFCAEGLLTGCAPSHIGTELTAVTRQACSNGTWSVDAHEVDGRAVERGLSCLNDDVGDSGWIEFDLGGRYREFRSVLGLDDAAESTDHVYQYRVYGDGDLLESRDVGFGTREELAIAVDDVLRLRLEVTVLSGTDNRRSRAVWASPTVSAAPIITVDSLPPVTVPDDQRVAELAAVFRDRCSSGDWETGERRLDGTSFPDSLWCTNDDVGDGGSIEFNLSRGYANLITTVGIDDASPTAADTYRVRISGDGDLLAEFDVSVGSTEEVDISVAGVLRLVLEVEKIAGPANRIAHATFFEPILTS